VVFCSDVVPFAAHRFRCSHLPESSIMGRASGTPAALREALKARIGAVIGDGPLLKR
jgi:hypothetical protein